MACIERAVVESLFTHWRVWAFLVLNLLLLAILFTSKSQTPSNENDHTLEDRAHEFEETRVSINSSSCEIVKREECVEIENINKEDSKQEQVEEQLSKEELNERVEAFIAMFRQHLVSDAKGKSTCGLHSTSKGIMGKPSRVNSIQGLSLTQSNKYVRA